MPEPNQPSALSGDGIDHGLDDAVQVFRAAALAWLAVVTALSWASVERPVAAVVGVVLAGAVTAMARRRSLGTRHRLAELAVGAGLMATDGWVFDGGQAQSFGSVWPLAGVLGLAVAAGARPAVAGGLVLGAARLVGEIAFVDGSWSATRVLGVLSTGVLFALAGWAASWAAMRIRTAERTAALAVARAEVAADLHDGVLQTLAVVQRRSDDADLVRLARTQEHELRRSLAAGPSDPGGPRPIEQVLRAATAQAADQFGVRAEVAVVPPAPVVSADRVAPLTAVVRELLANVAKHADVDRAVVFAEAERDGDRRVLVVGVADQGVGFVPDAVVERGLRSSVRDRVDRMGGSTSIESNPGAGTTVTVRLPVAS